MGGTPPATAAVAELVERAPPPLEPPLPTGWPCRRRMHGRGRAAAAATRGGSGRASHGRSSGGGGSPPPPPPPEGKGRARRGPGARCLRQSSSPKRELKNRED
ncbi:unnamed protein product [Miscanthus lutarioriparius]|uniref:Uncharacterized protein n=1 Tax=Miscanthus lutarioriparius TaxID=422564 RepID=A0A811PWB1_9POAL|nr:unnamed protein product [Miscanthus lutarioriparius]